MNLGSTQAFGYNLAIAALASPPMQPLLVGGILATIVAAAWYWLAIPSRTYVEGDDTVGKEYDAWTEEGILEYYWGDHIHLGYYNDEDRRAVTIPWKSGKVFKETKYRFIDEMYKWSGVEEAGKPAKVLDVGCGIGGTSRYLAKKLGAGSEVLGISLSPKQVQRATELAAAAGLPNAEFRVMDALKMDLPDNSFDLVWGCESGEHMPDKRRYVEEMARVLKPGGTLVIATWCQREAPPDLSPDERARLQFLYDEWAHPYFVSVEEYERLAAGAGLARVAGANWVKETITAWRHSIWVGIWDPWIVIWKGLTTRAGPRLWLKTVREIVTLERMHRAFASGLMTYGMIRARKPAPAE